MALVTMDAALCQVGRQVAGVATDCTRTQGILEVIGITGNAQRADKEALHFQCWGHLS